MSVPPRAPTRCVTVGAVLLVALGIPRPVTSQLRSTLDVSAASIRYGDAVRVTATTLAPAIRVDRGPITTLASGSFSAFAEGAWSTQGSASVSVLSRPIGPSRLELASAFGGTMHHDGTRGGQYLARARLHAGGATRGLWLGAAAGRGWDGSVWLGSLEGDAAVWGQHDNLTMLAAVRPVVSDSIRYTDLTATVRHDAARAEVAAVGGLRTGLSSVPGAPNAWASFSAALWIAPQIAVVADAGSYPADVAQNLVGGSYLSLAIRIAPARRTWTRVRQLPSTDPLATRTAGARSNARVEVIATSAGSYAVRVHAPSARRVDIMGDFTEWQSTEAAPAANGWWVIVTRITPGAHQMNVRLDRGRWTIPNGAMAEEDEFGTPVGVVIVR